MKYLSIFSILFFLILSCKSTDGSNADEWIVTQDSTLALRPEIKIIENTLVVFILEAKRLLPREETYFPTSEDFRVQIYSPKNVLLWNSDYEMSFLTVISSVEPLETGNIHTYRMEWYGTLNNGKPLPSGEYNVVMILPCKPESYVAELKFDWK